MSEDARFEDGAERALRLRAEDDEDLRIVAALVQDAVLPANEMKWDRAQRRFSCLINRFRWEDQGRSGTSARAPERVQAVLSFGDVLRVRHQGLDPREITDAVLSLLTVEFDPGDDGSGHMVLTFAGDGAIGLHVEAVNVTLQDVTRPYFAPSKRVPDHPE